MKAVIFDMDGVISDTQSLAAEVESKIFSRYGVDISAEKCTRVYAGTPHHMMYSTEFKKVGIEVDIDHVVKETWDILLNSEELVKPIDGIFYLIRLLEDNNYKLAVASGSIPKFIDMILKKLDIKDRFSAIVSAIEVKNGKPAPDIFLYTAKKLKIHPKDCVVIEDGVNGMVAAREAGMKCIGLTTDKMAPSDIKVTSLKEIDARLIESL